MGLSLRFSLGLGVMRASAVAAEPSALGAGYPASEGRRLDPNGPGVDPIASDPGGNPGGLLG